MIVKTGRAEVWAHCGEAGIQDDIKQISRFFDIKDISVVYDGKFSYVDERPRKYVRVKPGVSIDVNEFLKSQGCKFKITKA
ncbi:hypothetical protein HOR61_gp05 [Escherichia phage vB_EcoS-IME253]|uniref:Uncharacterized protein n=2 Tax=Rtpvirus TaxID=1920864 RepID=A0A9E7CLU8_9CAUD|nr:hypothetical protein HOR61_gp05 [Escherichia phage vB_EcoS-IME253]APU93205.1 hypothetical protein [Escherichia phage vB_EcoS-IME253]UMO77972.1 hypothetical protein [Escherichia phage ZL19]